jgi:gas vesicle protein
MCGEVEREAMSARSANLCVGMALLGGLVGAAVGLLVAPAPGTETRRRVVGRSIEDQELRLRRAEMAAELLGDELDLPATA